MVICLLANSLGELMVFVLSMMHFPAFFPFLRDSYSATNSLRWVFVNIFALYFYPPVNEFDRQTYLYGITIPTDRPAYLFLLVSKTCNFYTIDTYYVH